MGAVGQRLTLSEHWGSLPNIQHLLDLSHYSLLLPCRINVSNSSLQSTNLKSPQHLPLSPASSSLYTTNPHRDILTTSLPNHPDSLKCSVPLHLDKATDYPPITKSKDFSFPYSPLKCQLYFMLLTKLFLLPNPPHISTLLVFLTLPIILPFSYPKLHHSTGLYSIPYLQLQLLGESSPASFWPAHLNPSKMELIIFKLPYDFSYYC